MNQANNTPYGGAEPPPDYGPDPIPPDELIGTADDPTRAEPGAEWEGAYSFDPDAWFRDMIAPTPDYDQVDMTPEELAAAMAEPGPEELRQHYVVEPVLIGSANAEPEDDPEDAEAERLLYGMASDGNAWLRDLIGRQQGRSRPPEPGPEP